MIDLKNFTYQVEQMRIAQVQYFKAIALAKKSRQPGDFATASNRLKDSKRLEAIVDTSISEIQVQITNQLL